MTIEIPLTQGQVTIVDDIDKDLAEFKWQFSGTYAIGQSGKRPNRKRLLLHRVILARKVGRELGRDEYTDHENRNGLDNRRSNLRIATPRQNIMNKGIQKNNHSEFKGVHREDKKWRAQIKVGKKLIVIGLFDEVEIAAKAYDAMARQYFGEFAFLNFPNEYHKVEDLKKPVVLKRNNTSGYRGVSFDRFRNKFAVDVKNRHIGRFDNIIDAAKAYDEVAKVVFGDKAKLNFPL